MCLAARYPDVMVNSYHGSSGLIHDSMIDSVAYFAYMAFLLLYLTLLDSALHRYMIAWVLDSVVEIHALCFVVSRLYLKLNCQKVVLSESV